MKQSIICIAGAHRSGTSMLTRILHEAGLDLGPEPDMMPAQADNPDGFWENLRFVKINDEVLSELGGAWDLPPAATENFAAPSLDPIRGKARLLIESFAPSAIWGWKDPRSCLTLPFWNRLIGELKVLVIVRNPLEVAYSMRKRNGTSYAFGLRLWELYNRRLLAATKPDARLITNYDSFFAAPESEVRRVAKFAGLAESGIESAASLVTTARRHTSFTLDQLVDARISPKIIDLYRNLIAESSPVQPGKTRPPPAAAKKADAPASPDEEAELLPGLPNRLRVSVPEGEEVRVELASLRKMKLEHERLREELPHLKELAQRDGRIHELQTALAGRDREIRDARLELERSRRRLSEQESEGQLLREHNQQREVELQTLRERFAQKESEIEQLRERFSQTNQLLHSYSIQLSDRESDCVSLTARLRKQLGETKRLVRLLADTERAADHLRNSRRWILVNPFAWLASLFSKRPLRGFGHLDKIVKKFRDWQSAHPDAAELDRAIAALGPRHVHLPPMPEADQVETPGQEAAFKPAAPQKPIAFQAYTDVEVSIIIPVFNQIAFTEACLASIQKHADDIPFEVIVVDDCSTDATEGTLRDIPGLVYCRNERNSGFIESCNLGAQKARGQFLAFLNNDTEVSRGWVKALRETFALDTSVGLAGSKLIFPDGRLQEAGGIIWRDGSGWNRGKFDDPAKPEYNYAREVDYCSGACIMIPKGTFEEVRGFDQRFAPAYYEDVDLAFKLRRAAYKVLYQPLSQVIHFEGGTGGVDLTAGAKKYQEINRTVFAEKWAQTLSEKPTNGDVASLEKPPIGKQHILVVDHHLPMPDRDAGSLRMFNILHILQRLGHRVTFIPDNLADIPPYGAELQKRGVEVVSHPYLKSIRQYLEEHGRKFDTVVLSRCDFAKKHVADVRIYAPQARLIFDTVDLHFLRQQREAALLEDQELLQQANDRKDAEFQLIDQVDETWVVSTFEQKLLRDERPDKSIEIVSMIVDTPGSVTPFSLRRDFLFIGSFQHAPNIDAVLFFTKAILPLVKQRLATARFYIIGDKAPPSVIALADESVIVTGPQPEVTSFFDSVKLSVAPLRYGAGVKGKINQSMGLGVPVVATSLAAEGMPLSNGEDILLADSPEDFAQAIIELYENENLWERLSHNGVTKTQDFYSEKSARLQLARLFDERQSIGMLPGAIETTSAVVGQMVAAGQSRAG